MLIYFSVKNYRQFREELVFDLTKTKDYQFSANCVKDGIVNKAIIYGKNAVGKTNLMEAMRDIYRTFRFPNWNDSDHSICNADSNNDETIKFHYSFLIDNKTIDYKYEKKDHYNVVAEKLEIDDELIFKYDRKIGKYYFDNAKKIGAVNLNWNDFENMGINDDAEMLDTLTALRFVSSNTPLEQNSIFRKLIRFITSMRFIKGTGKINSDFATKLLFENKDEITGYRNVQELQSFLNEYEVECKLVALQEVDGTKKLYFDYKKPLDFFKNISSGTELLTAFYLLFVKNDFPISFIFIDEFDAFYHYELSEKIVKLLEERFDCQVILTSHNTNLLSNSIMRPDCFFILHDGKITPICDATDRELRQGHNLEKLYKSGEFNKYEKSSDSNIS